MLASSINSARAPEIVIIGKGKVGHALSQLLELSNVFVTLVGRSKSEQLSPIRTADIIIICVNDESIQTVCEQLAPSLKPRSIVSHCSAALDSTILNSAKDAGSFVASTHPLNTFPNIESALETFATTKHQTHLYAEGQHQALERLLPLFESLGFNTSVIEREAKPLYHVACVFACNYLNSLIELSMSSSEAAGLNRDTFWDSIKPIIYATLNNIDKQGTAKSLSGPVARGDISTIEKHIDALNDAHNSIKKSYTDLGIHSLKLAIESGELKPEKAAEIKKLLSGN